MHDFFSRFCLRTCLVLTCVANFGCKPESEKQGQSGPSIASSSISSGPSTRRVPNPDYVTWSKFAIGTKVVRKHSIVNDKGTVTITTSLSLAELSDKVAKVESQVTVERPERLTENPSQVFDYFSTQPVLESTTDEQVLAPLREAKLLREEPVEVSGKVYQARVYGWKTALESGPADVIGWFSDEFPGRQLRLETDFGADGKGTEVIVSFELPGNS